MSKSVFCFSLIFYILKLVTFFCKRSILYFRVVEKFHSRDLHNCFNCPF
ncbi:hypothetical protein LEP1GSC106_0774 [Leptospira interrogans serovar Grippotyphosa str. UI 12764]|nr:hypothetical protein LEP1GSC106_0774 [Leptospira interrogans serovar Grippotyphosa str. UI 12764]